MAIRERLDDFHDFCLAVTHMLGKEDGASDYEVGACVVSRSV